MILRDNNLPPTSHSQMNRPTEKSKVQMQVLALGLPRCATTSTAAALKSDVLGFKPTLHASDMGAHRNRSDLILDALRLQGNESLVRRRAKLHEIIDGYAACTESLNALADDLMDMYPDAKLILNVRPPPRSGESAAIAWARSCNETVGFFGSFWGLTACWTIRRYCF
jgi:Sulfotransferase domain